MANGHGGSRPGSGRKPKNAVLRGLDGGAGKRGPASAAVAVAPLEEFAAPDTLTMDQRHVWLRLAPHAFAARTLTKATMEAFLLLCRNVVIEQALSASAFAGNADHRGMIQRVDAEMAAFSLRPVGKPIFEAEPEAEKPANPLDRFLKRA